jgi:hypothetical protein
MPSTVVSYMHYYPESSTLRIGFVSGMVYDYKDVPEKVYQEMKKSTSKGTFLNKYIKERFPYKKVS